jgi:hypothetical protein
MSDLEVVAPSLTPEFMSIDSENTLFSQLKNGQISNLVERSQFNKRRRKLFLFYEEIRLTIKSNLMFLENQENALKLYSLNCVTGL